MIPDNKNIVVDLDNTLLEFRFPYMGEPIDGAVDTINTLTDMGYKITVYSCRNNPSLFSSAASMKQNLNDTEAALKRYGFKEFTIDRGDTGKPCALYYIDDAGLEFDKWEIILSKNKFSAGMAVSVGLEDCILDKENNLIEGAIDALDFFHKTGANVTLTSINEDKAGIVKILKNYQILYDYLDDGKSGKPVCRYYIEHNMIHFHGSWDNVLKRIIDNKV